MINDDNYYDETSNKPKKQNTNSSSAISRNNKGFDRKFKAREEDDYSNK